MKKNKKVDKKRCGWVGESDSLMIAYHDRVWGVPKKDDIEIFEALVLDTNQAGLSWKCILHKRENFAKAFYNFDPKKVAKMTERDVARLMKDAGIIRHQGKIRATIKNAQAFLQLQKEYGSAAKYFWGFTGGKVVYGDSKTHKDLPSLTELSIKMSKDLKRRGFGFTGPTMCYAFMQGIGIAHDHTKECFKYKTK